MNSMKFSGFVAHGIFQPLQLHQNLAQHINTVLVIRANGTGVHLHTNQKQVCFDLKFCEIVSNLAFWRRKNHWNLKKSIKSAQTKVTGRIVCQFERAIKKEKLDNIQTAMLLLSYNNVDRIRLGSSQTATGCHVQTLTSQNQVIW